MATGLPAVTLDGGGNRDFIVDGENGFILSEKNVQLFSQKIISLLNDGERYSAMSRRARETAERFDFDSYTENILKIYSAGN